MEPVRSILLNVCGCVHVCVCMYVCACMCVHVCVCMWVCACMCVHVYGCVCAGGCAYACMRVRVRVHVWTDILSYSWAGLQRVAADLLTFSYWGGFHGYRMPRGQSVCLMASMMNSRRKRIHCERRTANFAMRRYGVSGTHTHTFLHTTILLNIVVSGNNPTPPEM